MKKIIQILILTFLFTIVNNGQSKNNYQINSVKHDNVTEKSIPQKTEFNAVSERVFTTVIVLSELALLLGILFYWKKTYGEGKTNNKSIFKKNIQALRHERIKYFENEKLSLKRKMLKTKINKNTIDGKFITVKAKRLSISKGEVFLAARIKQLQARTQ